MLERHHYQRQFSTRIQILPQKHKLVWLFAVGFGYSLSRSYQPFSKQCFMERKAPKKLFFCFLFSIYKYFQTIWLKLPQKRFDFAKSLCILICGK